MALIKRRGDFRKCTVIFIAGAVLTFCGLPLMITGIAGTFTMADLVGYIGGICIFFGLGFFLVWYMFTIESKDSIVPISEYDPSLKNIRDIVEKSRAKERSKSRNAPSVGGFSNAAFVSDKSSEQDQSDNLTASAVTIDGHGQNNLSQTDLNAEDNDSAADNDLSQENNILEISATDEDGTKKHSPVRLESSFQNESLRSSRQSLPVEVT